MSDAVMINKLLSQLDDVTRKMDAYEAETRRDRRRDDDDGYESDAPVRPNKEGSWGFEDDSRRHRMRRDAGEAVGYERGYDDDRRSDRRRADSLSVRIADGMTADEEFSARDYRARMDSLYQVANLGRAPRPQPDYESLTAYRQRLLRPLLPFTKWKDTPAHRIDGSWIGNVEADAEREVPATINARMDATELRQVTRQLPSGHTAVEFHGRPRVWLQQFAGQRRMIAGISRPTYENGMQTGSEVRAMGFAR